MRRLLAILILFLVLAPSSVLAEGGWKTLKTDHFVVFYKDGHEDRAWRALEALEANLPLARYYGGKSARRIPVVLEDAGDLANGWSDPLLNQINLFSSPPRSGSMGYTPDWWGLLGLHETIHNLQMSNATLIPGFFADVLGDGFQPNNYIPSFILEGMAVFGESRISPFQGRLNDGYFHACLAAYLAEKRMPGIRETVAEPNEFPIDRAYVFGALFFDYLARAYGEDKYAKFVAVNGSSPLSYASPLFPFAGIDRSANRVFGKSFPSLWREWLEFEQRRFKGYAMDGRRISDRGWYLDGLALENGKLYAQRYHVEKVSAGRLRWFSRIVETEVATNEERVLFEVPSGFTGPLRVRNGKMVYAVQETFFGWPNVSYQGFGYGSNIYVRDLQTGHEYVHHRGSARAFDLLDNGTLLYACDCERGFGSDLMAQPNARSAAHLLFRTDLLIDQILCKDGKLVAVAQPEGRNFGLYRIDLKAKKLIPLVQTPYCETNPFIDGNRLYFRANYGRTYRIYAYDFTDRRVYRVTRGGFADYPAVDGQNRTLYYAGLRAEGYDVWQTPLMFEPFDLPTPKDVPSPRLPSRLDRSKVRKGGYLDNLATIWPRSLHTPTMSYNPQKGTDIGMLFLGQDALGDFSYLVATGYNTKSGKARISLDLDSYLVQPFIFGARVRNDKIGLELGVPLARQLDPIVDVRLSAAWHTFKGFSRHEFVPHFTMRLQGSRISALLDLQAPLESVDAGSNINRTAFYGHLRFEAHFLGEFVLEGRYIFDPENPEEDIFPFIRGYAETLPGHCGGIVTLQYSLPLLKLRGGLWNPTIWFEDVVATVFMDVAGQGRESDDWQASAGLELRLETKIMNSPVILFLPGIRGVVNLDEEAYLEPILEIAIGF